MSDERFAIRTYGCQMNVHDSEKLEALLEARGMSRAQAEADSDVLVINTCSIRDKAEHQLYSDLGKLRAWKAERPGRALAVSGCVAQQVGDRLLSRFPHVDFVFGTHQLRHVGQLLDRAREGRREAWTAEEASSARFELPVARASAAERRKSFVTVMEGCDMFCTFCIVPSTRGREISRRADEIEAEVRQKVDQGVVEVTLLGQTVNAYGRHDVRRGQAGRWVRCRSPSCSGDSTRSRGSNGSGTRARIRSSSTRRSRRPTRSCPASVRMSICPPRADRAGSSKRCTAAIPRERYLEVVAALKRARPDLVVTTDLIVGFPGETQAEFEATLSARRGGGLH